MLLRALVISDASHEYQGKKGLVRAQRLAVVDMDKSGKRLSHTLEYTMTEAEKEKFAGKVQDKFLNFWVTCVEKTPMGVIAFRGSIVSVE